jgi:DNA primase
VSEVRGLSDDGKTLRIANQGPGLVPEFQELPVPGLSDANKVAIKNAVDIVALVGEYLPVRRAGSKFKALCPFHDDHNPSLELNPERQSFKCWSCGAGGDIFDFVKSYEHVDFPEAMRMLADRAGIVLEPSRGGSAAVSVSATGPSKSDLFAVQEWAEELFVRALSKSADAQEYVANRGLSAASMARFRLGFAPLEWGWLVTEGRRRGFSESLLEQAGLVSRPEDFPGSVRERFRGRLIFPIHDERGRAIGFGGRILPGIERAMAAEGKNVAKYLNSPETPLFQKRKVLYAADLARDACRKAKRVVVVEGYTDVMAAHQVGVCNVVGTLGTALGEDHVQVLRRLSDRVVFVFDGDAAGKSAADRALELLVEHQLDAAGWKATERNRVQVLELFLGQELDVRVLSLPSNLDPCDFLLTEGADAFRSLVEHAVDPLSFLLERAGLRFDLDSIDGAQRAAEWVLGILSRMRSGQRIGMDLKLAKSLDTLAHCLRLPVEPLKRRLRELRRTVTNRSSRPQVAPSSDEGEKTPIRLSDLDAIDRELVQIVLNEPGAITHLVSRVAVTSLRDAPLRAILQACYDLHAEGQPPRCEEVLTRLEDPQIRALVAALTLSMDSAPLPDDVRPATWQERLRGVLATLAERERQSRLRDIGLALAETNEAVNPEAYRALRLEYLRLMFQRPDTK